MLEGKVIAVMALVCTTVPALAQRSDEVVSLGRIATATQLCGLRDQAWSFDLRRAALQSATKSRRFDDQALAAAPGSAEAQVSLGYADMEATEDFAASAPARTCGPLAIGPELEHADEVVRAFRAQRGAGSGS